jgi:hypothetical protein
LAFFLLSFSTLAAAQDVPQIFKSIQADRGVWRVELVQAPGGSLVMPPYTVCADDPLAAITYQKRPMCEKHLVEDTANQAVEESVCPTGTSTAVLKRDGQSVLLKQTSAASQVSTWRFTPLGSCEGKAI